MVAPIAGRLAELGVDVWFDREISAGESFAAVIRARLKEAKAVLVCWSPEAIESQWVDAEADHAREAGTYVPVFITPCKLMPPFNRIHTDDLSNWNRSTNDSVWSKTVERISKLIGRDAVGAAARAHASGDEKALYDFARRYPDEPAARKIWADAEVRHRREFDSCLKEARTGAAVRAARIAAEASDLSARVEATMSAFEAWLVDERRGTAKGDKPDPLSVVKRYVPAEERKLREEASALSIALSQAKAGEEELEVAKAEAARLSDQLQAGLDEAQRLRYEVATLSDVSNQSKASEAQLRAAKAEIAKLYEQLASARTNAHRPKTAELWSSRVLTTDAIKPLYTAHGTAQGGRNGHTQSDDGMVSIDLSVPKEMGGPGKPNTATPEHLFAAGYAACFGGALDFIAKQHKKDASKATVKCAVSIGPREKGGFGLAVVLDVTDTSLPQAELLSLAEEAHEKICPYSHATRGNVDVKVVTHGA